jgi:hypothetical protein
MVSGHRVDSRGWSRDATQLLMQLPMLMFGLTHDHYSLNCDHRVMCRWTVTLIEPVDGFHPRGCRLGDDLERTCEAAFGHKRERTVNTPDGIAYVCHRRENRRCCRAAREAAPLQLAFTCDRMRVAISFELEFGRGTPEKCECSKLLC